MATELIDTQTLDGETAAHIPGARPPSVKVESPAPLCRGGAGGPYLVDSVMWMPLRLDPLLTVGSSRLGMFAGVRLGVTQLGETGSGEDATPGRASHAR